ncbi:phospholipase A2 inhibitor and Ly6/PLAUR domain-containing protein-like isoform X2 [Ascaphus truei]|uniref:phospholipase A2 inhibitor and Ly6/PLAUR domain-containing protein-like isoform X2 n=1 Tax=Ascaphus truei TaxID=8439 RepID=UPI003F5A4289
MKSFLCTLSIFLGLMTTGGVEYITIRKGCENNPLLCNRIISVKTNERVNDRVPTQCCDSDFCNQDLNFQNSQIDTFPEILLQCPSCYNGNSTEECVTSTNVTCIKDQGQCMNYVGVLQLADGTVHNMSFKGCVTTGGCLLGFTVLPGTKELKFNIMDCTPALPIVPKPTVIPHPV